RHTLLLHSFPTRRSSDLLLCGATIFCESDFGFTLENCERSAQFVRGIGDEPALAFKGCVETIEKPVEGCGEAAEFILRILNGKADRKSTRLNSSHVAISY